MLTLVVPLALPAGAQAQIRELVHLSVEPLFGAQTMLGDSYTPILVTVENRSGQTLRGEVVVDARHYREVDVPYVVPLDLPSGATRRVAVTAYVERSGSFMARFVVDEQTLARESLSATYNPSEGIVVVMADPPRLRASLLEMKISQPNETTRGVPSSSRVVEPPVGLVRIDPTSSDPLAPEQEAGWSPARLVVASAPMLERLTEPQRRALHGWLHSGGHLLVFPRSGGDLRGPMLRGLAGPLALTSEGDPDFRDALVPEGAGRLALVCEGPEQRSESFGCSAPVGFGRVYVAAFDGASPPLVESPEVRALVRAVYADAVEIDGTGPLFDLGRGLESTDEDRYYYGPTRTIHPMRMALDPNEGYRPALILVALLLLLYVIVVGPLNFRWVQRKNKPTLALWTTPAAAAACLVLMLVLGYFGKGIRMRYRRVEVLEAREGSALALGRRYMGLFTTRPSTFDLEGPERGVGARVRGSNGAGGPTHHLGGARERMAGITAGLWETVFVREERFVELGGDGGGVRLIREGQRLLRVENHTATDLGSMVLVGFDGRLFVIGDVAAGSSAAIPANSSHTLPVEFGAGHVRSSGSTSYELDSIASSLNLSEDEKPYLRGVVGLFGEFFSESTPYLLARLPAPEDEAAQRSDRALRARFRPEADLRFLRIVPAYVGRTVAPTTPESALNEDNGYRGEGSIPAVVEEPEEAEPQVITPTEGSGEGSDGGAEADAGVASAPAGTAGEPDEHIPPGGPL